jgi:hypothetical protein
MVFVSFNSTAQVPRDIVFGNYGNLGAVKESWTAPCYILTADFADIVPPDEDQMPLDGNPHPLPGNMFMDNNNFVMPQFPEIGWNIPEPQLQQHQQHHPPRHVEEAWQPVQHEEPVIQLDPLIEEEDAVEEDVDSSIVNASADSNNVIDNGENEVQQNVVINSALICLQEPLLVK